MQLKPTPRPEVGDLAFALEASGEGLLLHDSNGRVVLANARAVRLLGFASVEELHGTRGVEPWSRVEWLDDRYMPFPPEHLPPMVALTGSQPQPLRLQLRPRNQGEEKWLEVSSRLEPDEGGSVRRVATVLRELPSAAPRAERHLRFLSEVTQLMTSSLDPRGTLRALALRAVPELADACTVDLLDDDGTAQLAAIVCTDALKEQRFRELRRTHRPRPDAPFSTARVLLTGKPLLHRHFTDADLQAMATSDQHLRWLREMRLTSAIAVALVARDHVLGVLSLVSTDSGRRYGEEDLAFAAELASRAALVVEHGRLHHRAETALRRKDDEVRVNEALGRLGTALASELDGDRLAQRIVDEATALTGAQFGVLLHHLPPEGGGPAQPYAYCGLHPEDFARFPTAATHALFCPALRTEPVIRSDDLAGDPRFAQQPALRDFVLPVASILAVPITSRSGAVMGGLFLGHVAAGVFTPEHERLIVNVAAQAAVALDNARLFAQVRNAEQQRQLNEDRLSHALEAGRMGYYDWDVPGGRTVMSPRLEELLGIVPGSSDGSVEAFQRAIHPEDRALVQERLQQLLTEPLRKHVTFEHRTSPGPDGACRWLECASRCVRDAGGQPLRVVGVVSDITERHRAQEAREAHAAELARSNAELERSNAELEQFAYVASHDLQEPLRMVASYTQLLSRRYKGKLDPDADEFISFAVEGVTRMKRLIGDLLTYARLGNKRHEPLPLSCDKALERALGNLKAAIDETGARVISTPLPTLLGDELQIELLLQNLVGNAIKFRGTEPPVIHVSAARHEDEWVVSVSDNGIGIEPQYFSRIFVIFQRLHSPQEYTGTGIGLAICKKIVERHNGRIWVDSELGRGSTFRFALPVPPMLEARLQKLA